MKRTGSALAAFLLSTICTSASAAVLSGFGAYEGVAGFGTPNGDIAAAPAGSNYVYVTTAGSSYTGAGYGLGSEANGSELTTNAFTASAGDVLRYFSNFITTDSGAFTDYAYARLNDLDNNTSINLYSARTSDSGNVVPGNGLPAIDSTVSLIPSSTPINATMTPMAAELGNSAGTCYQNASGCGYTGWIESNFTIADAGNYSFTFGVVNWTDSNYDTALAISGLKVGNTDLSIPAVPLPASGWMLVAALGAGSLLARRRKA